MGVRNCDWETGTERQLELKYCPSVLAWQPGLLVVLNTYERPGPSQGGGVALLRFHGYR